MLVVDTNVVVYLLTQTDKTAAARRLWATDPDWWAPRLLVYELANVFTRLVRTQGLPPRAAVAGLETGTRVIRLLQQEPSAGRFLEIAAALNLSAYDAAYLAAAEKLRVPLVTEDGRLLRAAPQLTRPLA